MQVVQQCVGDMKTINKEGDQGCIPGEHTNTYKHKMVMLVFGMNGDKNTIIPSDVYFNPPLGLMEHSISDWLIAFIFGLVTFQSYQPDWLVPRNVKIQPWLQCNWCDNFPPTICMYYGV